MSIKKRNKIFRCFILSGKGCDNIKKTIGIPRALLYYYDKDLWLGFFKYLGYETIISPPSNKKILEDGVRLASDEACFSLKLYLGHILELEDKCDVILVPRLYCIKKSEQVCTNFNSLYDLVNNLVDVKIINYNIDLTSRKSEVKAFLKLGKACGKTYFKSYKAYKYAREEKLKIRLQKEKEQKEKLRTNKIKILLAGHPYNLYDDLIGKGIIKYLEDNDIELIYSDKINHKLIDTYCEKISKDIHWTHSKEVMASIKYYQDKVDGIIIISSFPCGPDSLSIEMVNHKIKDIPLISLIFEDLNSETGVITRLESFIDILKNIKERQNEKSN